MSTVQQFWSQGLLLRRTRRVLSRERSPMICYIFDGRQGRIWTWRYPFGEICGCSFGFWKL